MSEIGMAEQGMSWASRILSERGRQAGNLVTKAGEQVLAHPGYAMAGGAALATGAVMLSDNENGPDGRSKGHLFRNSMVVMGGAIAMAGAGKLLMGNPEVKAHVLGAAQKAANSTLKVVENASA